MCAAWAYDAAMGHTQIPQRTQHRSAALVARNTARSAVSGEITPELPDNGRSSVSLGLAQGHLWRISGQPRSESPRTNLCELRPLVARSRPHLRRIDESAATSAELGSDCKRIPLWGGLGRAHCTMCPAVPPRQRQCNTTRYNVLRGCAQSSARNDQSASSHFRTPAHTCANSRMQARAYPPTRAHGRACPKPGFGPTSAKSYPESTTGFGRKSAFILRTCMALVPERRLSNVACMTASSELKTPIRGSGLRRSALVHGAGGGTAFAPQRCTKKVFQG